MTINKQFYYKVRVAEVEYEDGSIWYRPEVKWTRFSAWESIQRLGELFEFSSLKVATKRIDRFVMELAERYKGNVIKVNYMEYDPFTQELLDN